MNADRGAILPRAPSYILAFILFLTGVFLLSGGIYLAWLGGSLFFAAAGFGLVVSAILIGLRQPLGVLIFFFVFAVTILWSLFDVGLDFWPLFSRLFAPAVLAVPISLLLPAGWPRGSTAVHRTSRVVAGGTALALVATLAATFATHGDVSGTAASAPVAGKGVYLARGGDWEAWGRTAAGTRYAPLNQITPANVDKLTVAWTYRTGEIPSKGEAHVVTPLAINGTLYGCTHSSRLFALDAESGKELWSYDPKAIGHTFPRCRGVGYFDATAPLPGASKAAAPDTIPVSSTSPCASRIIASTVDARLIAVDAKTGKLCSEFGTEGIVDLTTGIGDIKTGFYFQTSAATVARGVVVVGARITDNQDVSEPSGVIRGFSARTGALIWAWDIGSPATTGLPSPGQTYTRGTPNMWAPPAYDDALGLIYLPTGNATPDFWGGKRSKESDRYSSAVVALDIATGKERWTFQTVHHDVWDYDVPAQPSLYDVPDGHGGTLPGLIQITKRGEIFLLDRRTGKPIAPVVERAVPQGAAPGDRLSPTQPFSIGMPAIGTEPLTESRMWGATLLDQLVCRIQFKSAIYQGAFTPQSTTPSVQYPGWAGGMNWGSASVAENLGYLIVNDVRLPMINRLIPRAEYEAGVKRKSLQPIIAAQTGTPFGLQQQRFLSPLGVPCQAPPFGTITAIDLATRKIVWSHPLGTVRDTGPLGIPVGLNIPIGMPTLGGPITTASGLIFMAGTQDYYIRALDVRTGKELWKGRLPVGGETTPMTYVAPRSGRQFVVISAGGNRSTEIRGDYIIAFALPSSGRH
ncbi:membrane-bound PQQ-dependent dehydrogenase, glucose/quinate/shikimate family [Sphingomonas sp. BIUV-7]|uniref:Membrane-bound PQQ-dependent dehydrogenase, glucose/quinate/shikimate family n=1 Tax=Sphingomonas natans TaxID=3063330 RepID=A0ABT8Y6V9_9SPHN|nr:membrane-bound PQQ-dependent dehydrogenase, glucose/quinate/shikimate family [Sphingomonas sp. BIUV-7]MDO6414036.1 membrane-bound PQQ-dependent dehydrogenase, glucose/quinate/shikimate family [Sphingomonas sp. BIUV-7]